MDEKFVFISFKDLFYNNIIFYLNKKHDDDMFSREYQMIQMIMIPIIYNMKNIIQL